MTFNTPERVQHTGAGSANVEAVKIQEIRYAKWSLLLQSLGVVVCDHFEELVLTYLNSGTVDQPAIAEMIAKYTAELEVSQSYEDYQRFIELVVWHPEISDAQLLREAAFLTAHVPRLDLYSITSLHAQVSEIEGGASQAAQLLHDWIKSFKNQSFSEPFRLGGYFGRSIHPEIRSAIAEINSRFERPPTLYEVAERMVRQSGWGNEENLAMQAATSSDFTQQIQRLSGDELKLFMLKNLDLYINRESFRVQFGSAPERFVEACRRIVSEDPKGRWARTIRLIFSESGHLAVLAEPVN